MCLMSTVLVPGSWALFPRAPGFYPGCCVFGSLPCALRLGSCALVPSAPVLPVPSCSFRLLLLLPAVPSNPFFQGVWLSFLFFSGGVPLPIWLRQKGFWGILGFGVGSGSRNG